MDSGLFFHDSTLSVLGVGFGVLGDQVNAFNDGLHFLNIHLQDLTLLPF
jgi:hypothetical protein